MVGEENIVDTRYTLLNGRRKYNIVKKKTWCSLRTLAKQKIGKLTIEGRSTSFHELKSQTSSLEANAYNQMG